MHVTNSISFCLYKNVFISPSLLKNIFTVHEFLVLLLFPFNAPKLSYHCLLASTVSVEKLVEDSYSNYWSFDSCQSSFSLAASSKSLVDFFPLYLFTNLSVINLGMNFFWFILLRVDRKSWILSLIFHKFWDNSQVLSLLDMSLLSLSVLLRFSYIYVCLLQFILYDSYTFAYNFHPFDSWWFILNIPFVLMCLDWVLIPASSLLLFLGFYLKYFQVFYFLYLTKLFILHP